MKKTIRLTESELYGLIEQSINEIGIIPHATRIHTPPFVPSHFPNTHKGIIHQNDSDRVNDDVTQKQRGNENNKQERQYNEAVAHKVTEGVINKLRQSLNEVTNYESFIGAGCCLKDVNYDELTQQIGDEVGNIFQNYFLKEEPWDANDWIAKVNVKFFDYKLPFEVWVDGGATINYDEDDQPTGVDFWTDGYEGSVFYDGNPWNFVAKNIKKSINWQKVGEIVSSYSMDASNPKFLEAYDTGMEWQVPGYDKNQQPRGRVS